MIAAAILAGGRATRYGGRDKSAILIDGRRILDRQLDALAPVAQEILLVGHPSPPRGLRSVADLVPDSGPLGGLHAALTASPAEVTLVLACDMPFVTSGLLALLIDRCDDVDAVVPRTERGYHPLCAAYRRTCLDAVARRLANRQLKLLDLLVDVRSRIVTADDLATCGAPDRLLANVNTPADVGTLEALHSQEL